MLAWRVNLGKFLLTYTTTRRLTDLFTNRQPLSQSILNCEPSRSLSSSDAELHVRIWTLIQQIQSRYVGLTFCELLGFLLIR